jgi:CubicO group peptidase (beta-lactamase class C family)
MPNKRRHARRVVPALGIILLAGMLVLVVRYRPDQAIRVGTASVSQVLCEEVFIAGLDPQRVFREEVEPKAGLRPLLKHLRFELDRRGGSVRTSWLGHFTSVSRYREGYGCRTGADRVQAGEATRRSAPARETVLGEAPANRALDEALERAFAEPAQPPYRRVRAIVVMHDGRLVAERYASGIGPDTPLLGYSVSKSVINALVGILVRKGKLQVGAPAPVARWNGPGDPRHAISLDELLRMTSGLALKESDSGFDPVSRMLFLHADDMAAYAERAPLGHAPGSTWEYTSGNTLVVSAIVRDAVGGSAQAVRRFARQELFEPLGMRNVTMEFDRAGTPVGSTRIFASARDWARFGQLYLDRGMAHGRRVLPEGWVRYSTTPTLDSDYGAGFWVNAGRAVDARLRVRSGMPADTFFASGLFGQRIVVVPSMHLVIVRFGATIDPPDYDIRGLERLVADVIAAVPAGASAVPGQQLD